MAGGMADVGTVVESSIDATSTAVSASAAEGTIMTVSAAIIMTSELEYLLSFIIGTLLYRRPGGKKGWDMVPVSGAGSENPPSGDGLYCWTGPDHLRLDVVSPYETLQRTGAFEEGELDQDRACDLEMDPLHETRAGLD